MTPEQEIMQIKKEHFDRLKNSRRVWMIEESGSDYVIHVWGGPEAEFGAGVAPSSAHPTLRKAASRLLQLLHTGPVAPQTWPEKVCIGSVAIEPADLP